MKKPLLFLLVVFGSLGLIKFFFPEALALADFDLLDIYRQRWIEYYGLSPIKILLFYFGFNTLLATLPVPGISAISFLGGALFGFPKAVAISSLATAIGNLGGFFLARYFLQDWVMKNYASKIKNFNKNWQRDGAMTLFSMRLFVFIPSFVANLIMGVSPLKAWTFFWVSWAGRIPIVIVYAYAGATLSQVNSLEDILSMPIILALTVLALMPWIVSYLYKLFMKENPKAL
jgi:uncharacterized membrane protein YdjX (TVP38/TMEM64 family)